MITEDEMEAIEEHMIAHQPTERHVHRLLEEVRTLRKVAIEHIASCCECCGWTGGLKAAVGLEQDGLGEGQFEAKQIIASWEKP